MRRRRARLRTMLVVAVLLIAAGSVVGIRVWRLRSRAHHHRLAAAQASVQAFMLRNEWIGATPEGDIVTATNPDAPARRTKLRAQAKYHREMESKYLHAASHPWLPIEPDPPEPE
jgi:hypothetical protein